MSLSPACLLLVRHAQVDCSSNGMALLCGSHDAPLSEEGRRQVVRLAGRLQHEPGIHAAYSSPLRRAVATAGASPAPLLRRLRSLAEIHCGEVEGLPLDEVRRRFPDLWLRNEAQQDVGFRWPGGETYGQFRRRVLRVIRSLARVHAGEKVLVFTHAGVVTQVVGALRGRSAAQWENPRPGNTSITEVLWKGETGEVIRFDDRAHLL